MPVSPLIPTAERLTPQWWSTMPRPRGANPQQQARLVRYDASGRDAAMTRTVFVLLNPAIARRRSGEGRSNWIESNADERPGGETNGAKRSAVSTSVHRLDR